jgi:hypothetical protein
MKFISQITINFMKNIEKKNLTKIHGKHTSVGTIITLHHIYFFIILGSIWLELQTYKFYRNINHNLKSYGYGWM